MVDNVLRFRFLGEDRVSPTFDKVAGKADGLSRKLTGFGKIAGFALTGAATAAAGLATAGVVMGVKTAAGLEQAQVGFTTLLGSGQRAQTFLAGLKRFAAATPFELPGLVDSSRLLIGVGVNTKDTMKILQSFGDAAGAVGVGQEQFQRIMLATSQAIGAGRFMTADLNQITENGIPIWTELAKATGKPIPELREMASQGKLLSKDVLPILEQQMNKDYGGSMAKQSRTLNGLWSTFMDTLNLGMATAIQPLIPMLKTGLAGATKIAGDALQGIPKIVGTVTSSLQDVRTFVVDHLVPGLSDAFGGLHFDLPDLGPGLQKQAQDWGGLILLGVKTGFRTGDWGELGRILGHGLSGALDNLTLNGAVLVRAIGRWVDSVDWLKVGESVGATAIPFAIGFVNTLADGLFDVVRQHPVDVALFVATLIPVGKFVTAFKPIRAVLEHLPFGSLVTGALDRSAVPIFDATMRALGWMGRGVTSGFHEINPGTIRDLLGWVRGFGDTLGLKALYLADKAQVFIEGMLRGIGRMAGRVAFTIRQVIGWETRPFTDSGRWLVTKGSDLLEGLLRGVRSMSGALGRGISSMIGRVRSPFANAGGWLYQAGRSVLTGLRDGMFNGVQAAGTWAARIGGNIVRAVKGFFGIHSPSRLFAGIGTNLITSLLNSMSRVNPVQFVKRIFGGMPQALGAMVSKGLVHIENLPGKALSALSGLGGKFAGLLGGLGTGGGARLSGGLSPAERWIIMHESGGRTSAQNPTSTAFGLGQLLIANRVHYGAILGVSPNTQDYAAQLSMFRMYVRDRYGNAENAQRFWAAHHWYGTGAYFSGPRVVGVGETGNERLLSPRQTVAFERMVQVMDRGGAPGGGATTLTLVSDGTAASNAMVEILRAGVRARGGDVQKILGRAS